MTADELYDLFRKDCMDTVRPYLWSDDEVWAYMNDAYRMFVRLTGGISDFTSDACTVRAIAGEATSELHPAILTIRMATLDDGSDVRIINAQDMTSLNDEDFGVLRRINFSTSVGKVRYMVIGMQKDIARWVNIPDRDYEVNLIIERLPLQTLAPGSTLDEIQDHHHFHLLRWMQYLAYNKQDAETFNKARSDAMKAEFEAYAAFAKREKDKYKHKVRVVKYGGY